MFDITYKEQLQDLYATTVWSDLPEDLKTELKRAVANSLVACKIPVPSYCNSGYGIPDLKYNYIWQKPPERELVCRIKGFYCSRRNVAVTKGDAEKQRKRKLILKASRQTFVSYIATLANWFL